MKQNVRWGLLSTAHINRRLIPAIRASKRGTLAAVASRESEKAGAYAAEWGIPYAFGSYEEMLASDAVDIVYIGLPNHMHAAWTIRALEAGKHVLCEKPFALTIEEVDRMIDASRRSGRVLFEAFMYRHHPQTRLVDEWVREGRLGEIRLFRSAFSFYMHNREGNVRLAPEYGGGALWDVGVYPVSFAQVVMGALPQTVAAAQWKGPTGVDESFSGLMTYANGSTAQIYGGFSVPFFTSVEIHGSLGRLELNRPFTGVTERDRFLRFTPVEGKPENLRVKSVDPYFCEVEAMHDCVLDGKSPVVTLEESRDHIRTVIALYEAARTGEIVRLAKEK
jgi:predicted dehydrogenase